ncbi:MAG: 2-isopropylmalate synthase [Chloroflexi bacterium]|uniref:2-isopropylmalate synthase n=1 Tax=Candidatus Chlorohelix allophototropha TaxID=3003348 RepID=A0A8T7LU83_9CHLR|nr:2-isopropylmalate synthase [Chloroflexota bacterium]WJW67471.1 2-isopropylmalate synthase [Chloroflexota bacterium L227-S17]
MSSQSGESGVVSHDKNNRVIIFDTTLRDGEQSPGATMNVDEKIEIAKQLARLGVDVIEAGFPISSEGDFEAVRRIAQEVKGPTIAGLARARAQDIDRCWEAVKHSDKPRIHVFISSSDIHLQHLFKLTREEALVQTREMVAHAKQYCDDIEFSAQDATRSELDYLCQMIQAAVDAGATTVNLPDTVGYTTPDEYENMILTVKARVKGIENVIISVHCHNDLGMAVANSLTTLRAGARQVECTINGIGERAGNAALEEIVMALNTRGDFFNLWTGVDIGQIQKTSRMVSSFTGIPVQPNKAIVGSNAFAHESGIHQDGMLKERRTYEIMDASAVGAGDTNLVLGKHSGRHAFKKKLQDLGYYLEGEELNRAFFEFKQLCDRKKTVTDRELEALVIDQVQNENKTLYRLEQIQATSGDKSIPTATVKLVAPDGTIVTDSATGDGPVDAVCAAINRITGVHCVLSEFNITAITKGIDSMGEVAIKVSYKGRTVSGHGAHTDIIVASARAYLQAVNRFVQMGEFADESGADPYRRDEFGPLAGTSRAFGR